jgi:cyclopropane fatty-acyl-phospholipid synthase-like methyltransferase
VKPGHVSFLLRALCLKPGSRILDIPCGDGRLSLHLARAGMKVTGIDLNRGFVETARSRFREEKLRGTFVIRDMRDIHFQSGFDAVICWRNSFGYFSDGDNRLFLSSLAASLVPGGRILVDQANRECLLRYHRPGMSEMKRWIDITSWDGERQRFESEKTWRETGEKYRVSVRLYTRGQFEKMFRSCGLTPEAVYGDHEGGRYRRNGPCLIAVGVK